MEMGFQNYMQQQDARASAAVAMAAVVKNNFIWAEG
jgi:hypothetical protein